MEKHSFHLWKDDLQKTPIVFFYNKFRTKMSR